MVGRAICSLSSALGPCYTLWYCGYQWKYGNRLQFSLCAWPTASPHTCLMGGGFGDKVALSEFSFIVQFVIVPWNSWRSGTTDYETRRAQGKGYPYENCQYNHDTSFGSWVLATDIWILLIYNRTGSCNNILFDFVKNYVNDWTVVNTLALFKVPVWWIVQTLFFCYLIWGHMAVWQPGKAIAAHQQTILAL